MKLLSTTLIAAALAMPAAASTISVTITNNSGDNGVYFTPFLNVVHDGTYTPFEVGQAASSGLETLAELGGTAGAAAEALDASDPNRGIATLVEPTGVGDPAIGGPPVFDPGNSATLTFDLNSSSQYLTLLSMIIPSNDTFVSATFDLFDADGNLNLGTFAVGRDSVYDAGTEVNQTLGQAFNPADGNGPGALGEDENGTVHLSTDAELATLFGQPVPPFASLFTTDSSDVDFSNLLTITIAEVAPVPLPASGLILLGALGGMGVVARRKKKAEVAG
ncbi:MAG: spondin domain-containing protein [Sedimentitalea sp.]|uniref:spondin domain-containing protein n=1 Tax=Rhodobacterales TaxID=204455 RepID=UPI0032988BE0